MVAASVDRLPTRRFGQRRQRFGERRRGGRGGRRGRRRRCSARREGGQHRRRNLRAGRRQRAHAAERIRVLLRATAGGETRKRDARGRSSPQLLLVLGGAARRLAIAQPGREAEGVERRGREAGVRRARIRPLSLLARKHLEIDLPRLLLQLLLGDPCGAPRHHRRRAAALEVRLHHLHEREMPRGTGEMPRAATQGAGCAARGAGRRLVAPARSRRDVGRRSGSRSASRCEAQRRSRGATHLASSCRCRCCPRAGWPSPERAPRRARGQRGGTQRRSCR